MVIPAAGSFAGGTMFVLSPPFPPHPANATTAKSTMMKNKTRIKTLDSEDFATDSPSILYEYFNTILFQISVKK
jgi:hypothetical protein